MNQIISAEEQELPKQQEIESLTAQLEALPSIEEKLKVSIDFMRDALSQPGTPNFKGFWDVRKICLPLFKETISVASRTQLWTDYTELTREGRRLKNLLDEETAFAVEQIDLAIGGLEGEVSGYHTHLDDILEKTPEVVFPEGVHSLEERFELYQKLQKQLNLLNVYASRINSLRKELIRTDMRIRQKNKFFQRLSALGDGIFPLRKDLIRQVSEAFVEDVSNFVDSHFSEENFNEDQVRRSVFFFRNEIKTLQATAKVLTLNTHAFSTTREILSGCWDKLKGMEKELKKEFTQHKQESSQNAAEIKERIDAFVQTYSEDTLSQKEALFQLDEISRWMRNVNLARYDVRMLKEALAVAREPIDSKLKEEEALRRQKEVDFENARREKVDSFKQQVESLLAKIPTEEISLLSKELDETRKTLHALSMSKIEKQQFDRILKNVRDQIAERQQQALFDLSDDDREALDNLETILTQRNERRKEIKLQIEEYRKVIGGSGLDFEKAMKYDELMDTEKTSLAKIDENISEIKKKIKELKKNA